MKSAHFATSIVTVEALFIKLSKERGEKRKIINQKKMIFYSLKLNKYPNFSRQSKEGA